MSEQTSINPDLIELIERIADDLWWTSAVIVKEYADEQLNTSPGSSSNPSWVARYANP